MTGAPRLLGVVLAGGDSRRFGRSKGEARVGDLTLVERAARTLRPLCAEVVVGRPPALPDLRPGQGPLAGLEAALVRAAGTGAHGVVVLACDLPAVHTAALSRLVTAWRQAPSPPTAVAVPHEPLQPLCGVWGVETRAAVSRALDEERRSAGALVRELPGVVTLPAVDLADELGLMAPQLLHNVNHPEELAEARELVLPPVVSVVGWKDSGKTTVAVALVKALVERGVDAVAAKHGHRFRLDTEGTDSWRLRHDAGARRVLLAGPGGMALVGDWRRREPGLGGLVRRWLRDAEVVVAEGWKSGPWPAVEVRAPGSPEPPLHTAESADAHRFLAVVGGPGLPRDRPDLGERLADVVTDRVLRTVD